MTTVGITGHMGLTTATRMAVAAEITRALSDFDDPVIGHTSLAPGADQIFAFSVLAAGGTLVFVQPCAEILTTIPEHNRPAFEALRSLVADTTALPHTEPSEHAFYDAGAHIADTVDILLAVWDGKPAGGFGGTADIVDRRRASGRPLTIIWPHGSARG